MKTQYYLLLFLSFFIYSCNEQVEINFPKLKSKLVVNGYICPDSVLKVNVSASSDFNDTAIVYLNDAKCKIFEDNNFLFYLKNIGNGNYIAPSDYKPKQGKIYKIEVSHDKYDTVFAEDKIPGERPIVTNIIFKNKAYIDFEQYVYSQFDFDLQDNVETKDYYELMIFGRQDSMIIEKKYDYYTYMTTKDFVLSNEGLAFPVLFLPFKDNLFNGQNHLFKINFDQFNNYYTIYLTVLRVSKNYYMYHKNLIKHMDNQEGNFWEGETNPVVLFTNVKNGYGAFVAYNSFIDSCKNY